MIQPQNQQHEHKCEECGEQFDSAEELRQHEQECRKSTEQTHDNPQRHESVEQVSQGSLGGQQRRGPQDAGQQAGHKRQEDQGQKGQQGGPQRQGEKNQPGLQGEAEQEDQSRDQRERRAA